MMSSDDNTLFWVGMITIPLLWLYYHPTVAAADPTTVKFNEIANNAFAKAGSIINASLEEPLLQRLSSEIIGSKRGNLAALADWEWVAGNIRYTAEPYGEDVYQPPIATVANGAGDCEDTAMLVVTLGKIAGLSVKLVIARYIMVVELQGKAGMHMYAVVEGFPCDPQYKFGEHPYPGSRTHYAEVVI